MKVEFARGEGGERTVVGTAEWRSGHVAVDAEDPSVRAALERVFRPTAVAIDDGSYRQLGTHGEVVVQPGDLEWFRAVALVRAPAEAGLTPRFVAEVVEGGYDPAANYRSFEEQVERITRDAPS
jgi:hypothetical protein